MPKAQAQAAQKRALLRNELSDGDSLDGEGGPDMGGDMEIEGMN